MSSFFLSLWLITSLLFSETTTRHHVDVDGEYLALDILDTAGKVNTPDPFMSPDYSQLSPCGHTAITNTPIIRTTAKSQCKNESQIFDWNKRPLMPTLNRVPSVSAVKWVNSNCRRQKEPTENSWSAVLYKLYTFQVELCVTHYCFHCIFACEYSLLFSLPTII